MTALLDLGPAALLVLLATGVVVWGAALLFAAALVVTGLYRAARWAIRHTTTRTPAEEAPRHA